MTKTRAIFSPLFYGYRKKSLNYNISLRSKYILALIAQRPENNVSFQTIVVKNRIFAAADATFWSAVVVVIRR